MNATGEPLACIYNETNRLRVRRIITLILLLVLARVCSFAQVQAHFTASQIFGCPPLVVSFTDQSTGGVTSRVYDFDNGNTSSQPNPTASFPNDGVYNVLLSVTDGVTTDTETIQIRVFKPAAPNFTAPDNHGCVQPCHTVHFQNLTIPGDAPVNQYVF